MAKEHRTEQHFDTPILIDLPLPIITPRLLIRSMLPGDGVTAREAIVETFDQLHETMAWAKKVPTEEEAEIRARESYVEFLQRKDLQMIGFERDSGRLVVFTGLHRLDWQARTFEIGYWVRKSAQGQGYATEVANALTRYAFEVLRARRVGIGHAEGNDASKAVIKKLAFPYTCEFKSDEVVATGEVKDTHFYTRTDMKGLPDLDVHWGDDEQKT
jgi:RimJ/RimL family protein N-acetyltransferase